MKPPIQPLPVLRLIFVRLLQSALAFGAIAFGFSVYSMIAHKGTDGLGLVVMTCGGALAGAFVGLLRVYPLFSGLDRIRQGDCDMFPAIVQAVSENDVATLRNALGDPRLNVRLAAMEGLTRLQNGTGAAAVPDLLLLLAGRSPAQQSVCPGACSICGTPLTRWNTELTGPRSGKCGRCLRGERIAGLSEAAVAARTLGHTGPNSSEVVYALTQAARHGNAELSREAQEALVRLSRVGSAVESA